ncbi:InlB B-repeat-containing protein [Thiolapillus sp.]
MFERDSGGTNNWGETRKLLASDGAADDFFSISVDIDGDTVIIGAKFNDDKGTQSGAAYIFSRNQGGSNAWGEVRKLLASDGAADDWFGHSVAIIGDTAVVGAYLKDGSAQDFGAAYRFSRNEGGADNWGETAKLEADDGSVNDQLGYSVAVGNDAILVGAHFADGNASTSGAVYLFSQTQAYPVTVSVGDHGSVSADSGSINACTSTGGVCSGNYSQGTNLVLTATPDSGYVTAWSGPDSSSCTANTCTFNAIASAKSVTASFSQATYQVTASVDAHGALDKSSATVALNSSATFTVTANPGYRTDTAVGGSCPAGSWNGTTYTTGPVTANCSVSFTHTPENSNESCSGGAIKKIEGKHYNAETSSCTADFQINMGPTVTLDNQSHLTLTAAAVNLKPSVRVASGSTLRINSSTARVGALNQALLSSLSGASIYAYRLSDLENPVEGPWQTVVANDVTVAGRFALLLDGIPDDEWILVAASGGRDIDADDDGNTNTPSTPNKGTLYGLAKAREWRNGNVHVTALTDLAWRFTRSLIHNAAPTELHIRLDDLARALIAQDINTDGVVDHHDIHAFVPHDPTHRSFLNFDYDALIAPDANGNSVIGAHHAGDGDLLETLLENKFGSAFALYPGTDNRYDQVQVEVVLSGRGLVVSDIGGVRNYSEFDPYKDNKPAAWLNRNPNGKLVLTATPISSTQVLGWMGCDQVSADLSRCTVALDRSHQVMAKFGYKSTELNAAVYDLSGAAVVLGADTVLLNILPSQTGLIDALQQLKNGDFVVGPDGIGGFLRKVTAFDRINSTTYRLTTLDAMLKDVIGQGTWGFSATLTNGDLRGYQPPSATKKAATFDTSAFTAREGVRLIPSDDPNDNQFHLVLGAPANSPVQAGANLQNQLDVVLWQSPNGNGKISAQGVMDIGINLDVGANYSGGLLSSTLEDFHFTVSEKSKLDIKFIGEGIVDLNTLNKQIKVKIASIPIGNIYVLVGGIFPVWVTPEISIYLGVEGGFKASLSAGVTAQSSQTVGLAYKRGVKGFKTVYQPPANSWNFIKPEINGEATLKGYAEATVEFLLYGVTGPEMGTQSYLQLQGTVPVFNEDIVTGQGCKDGIEYSLKLGLNGLFRWDLNDAEAGARAFLKMVGVENSEKWLAFEFSFLKLEHLLAHGYLTGQCAEDPPFLKVSGENIDALVDPSSPALVQKSYLVENIGKGKLPWSVQYTDDAAISVSPASGELAESESAYVVVEVDTGQLQKGVYRNKLLFENGFRTAEGLRFGALGSTFREVEVKVVQQPNVAPTITGFEDRGDGFGLIEWNFDASSLDVEMRGYEIYLQVDGDPAWTIKRTVYGIDTMSTIMSGLPKGENVCFRMQAYGEHDTRTPNSSEHCVQLSGGELSLTLANSLTEGNTATATLSRSGDMTDELSVYLDSNDVTEADVPASVTLPTGENSTSFTVTAVADGIVDGDQPVTISAYLAGWGSAQTKLTVTDEDSATPKTWQQIDTSGFGTGFHRVGGISKDNIYFAKQTGSALYTFDGTRLAQAPIADTVSQIFDFYADLALVKDNGKVGIYRSVNNAWQSLNIPSDKTTSFDGTLIWSAGNTIRALARGPRYISYIDGSWRYYCQCDGDEITDLWGPDADHYYKAYYSTGLGKRMISFFSKNTGTRLIDEIPALYVYGIPNGDSPGTIYAASNTKIYKWVDGVGVSVMPHPLTGTSGYNFRGMLNAGGTLYIYGQGPGDSALLFKLSGGIWTDISPANGMHDIYDMWAVKGNLYVAAYDQLWYFGNP